MTTHPGVQTRDDEEAITERWRNEAEPQRDSEEKVTNSSFS